MPGNRFTLTLPGDPVAKGRPRVYGGHAITPRKTVRAEERIFAEFRRKYPNMKPFAGPVSVYAEFWMSHRGKPDVDNLLKTVLDALNAVAYMDDSQIIHTTAKKYVPDQLVRGKRDWRKRRKEDPYMHYGHEYEPHLFVRVTEIPEWNPIEKESE
ncbi:crossover junction endodeoxyribonuclease RusA [Bifidobacterium biavatii DSM 23969]|uniref:Crossover junction endodeoxyribonuclease RusA n=2 Tax=Bifidobacterium biavatii TaxID=762212 RepID=A0A086ZYX3_9BIFI|nr:crossover junction endodeoxyribonuclease RusA [Bifidobacterium biavatii DSM 23969]